MINKYIKNSTNTIDSEAADFSANNRIGALKGVKFFAPDYDFDEDNEVIAKLFGEVSL